MTKQGNKTTGAPQQRSRRLQILGILAVVIVCAIAATAISMQASKGEPTGNTPDSRTTTGNPNRLRSAQDGQNLTQAQIRPLTQEEAQQLAEGIKALVNQSTDGLKQVKHADGSVSMDLEGRFQNVALAKRTADGNIAQSCVDNPAAAAAFLGINQELIDKTNTAPSKKREPAKDVESGGPGKGQY